MTDAFSLNVQTRGGVQDLARVVGVMALYDLTPSDLKARQEANGLRIDGQFKEGAHAGELSVARLRQLTAVAAAEIVFPPVCGIGGYASKDFSAVIRLLSGRLADLSQ